MCNGCFLVYVQQYLYVYFFVLVVDDYVIEIWIIQIEENVFLLSCCFFLIQLEFYGVVIIFEGFYILESVVIQLVSFKLMVKVYFCSEQSFYE